MLTGTRLFSKVYNGVFNYLTTKIDLLLLVYLLLILNARLGLNIIAICLIFLIRRDIKVKLNGITYFYITIIILSLLGFFVTGFNTGNSKILTVLMSCVLWLFCLLNFHQLWLSVRKNSIDITINTVKALAVINFFASLFYLIKIMIIRKTINPYLEDAPPPYGINTGDLIGGVFGGNHDVNSIMCAMLFILFMYQKDFKFALLALISHLLTGNNFLVIILFAYIIYLLIFSKSNILRYYSILSLGIMSVFYVKITTPNYYYLTQKLGIGNKSPHDFFLDEYKKNSEDPVSKKSLEIDSLYNLWKKNEQSAKSNDSLLSSDVSGKPNDMEEAVNIEHITNNTIEPVVDTPIKTEVVSKSNIPVKEESLSNIDTNTMAVTTTTVESKNEYSYASKRISAYEDKISDSVRNLRQKKALHDRYSMLRVRDSVLEEKAKSIPTDMVVYDLDNNSGKMISFVQTKNYLLSDWKNFLFGSGPGGFSSRLAFMHSDLIEKQTRFLTWLPNYETEAFRENHKSIYKYILHQDTSYNTFSNKPFSFYNEILGEYGFIGFMSWIILYIGFFLKRWRYLTFTKFLLPFTLVVLVTDYWYHGLTIIVMLELLTLLDLKINNHQKTFLRNE